jgi:hypothetical protein
MYRQDQDVITDQSKIDSVGKPSEDCSSRLTAHTAIEQRVFDGALNSLVERRSEGRAQPRLTAFVPVSRLECFRLGLGSKTDPAIHSRSISFRRTSSHGIADSGR